MLTLIQIASCDTKTSAFVMPVAVAIMSHDPISHVSAHFDCLDERNVVIPLTMLMASCDVVSVNGRTSSEMSC